MFYEVIVSHAGVPCEEWQAEGDSPEQAASSVQAERIATGDHFPDEEEFLASLIEQGSFWSRYTAADTYHASPLRTADDIMREGITPVDVARILALSGWSLLRETNGSVVARRGTDYAVVYDPSTKTRTKEAKLLSEALGWAYYASPGAPSDWPDDWPHTQIVRELDELVAAKKPAQVSYAIVDRSAKLRTWYGGAIPLPPNAEVSCGSVRLPANLGPAQAFEACLLGMTGDTP